MAITNERIRQMVFDAQSNPTTKFIVLALEALLESQVGAGATDDILDTFIPNAPTTQLVLFGHKIGDYSGLNRATLKAIFTKPDGSALVDADVDAIFAALGATEGLTVQNPFGTTEGTDEVADLPVGAFHQEAKKTDEELTQQSSEQTNEDNVEEFEFELEDKQQTTKKSGGKKGEKS